MFRSVLLLLMFVVSPLAIAGFEIFRSSVSHGLPNQFNFNAAPYTRIGEKLYYVETQQRLNWFNAVHRCRQLSGNLASIENPLEMELLANHLKMKSQQNNLFWLSQHDLGKQSSFTSIATGLPMSYANWSPGQPDNYQNKEHCVQLWWRNNVFQMNDAECGSEFFFICQSDEPKTVTFTVW